MIHLQQFAERILVEGCDRGENNRKTGARPQVREKPMGQLTLDSFDVVLVESNSVALVRTLFCPAYLP